MRTILATTLILISTIGFTQSNFQINKKSLQYRNYGKKIIAPYYYKKPQGEFFSLPDSTKESIVTQIQPGNMPCIIPNMRKFNNMPNATKPADLAMLNQIPGAIPNPLFKKEKLKIKPFIKPYPNKEGS